MAAEEFGGFDPFFVVIDGGLAFFFRFGTNVALAVDHDEDVGQIKVSDASFEFGEVCLVLGFVFEERIYVFESVNVVVFLHIGGPI